MAYTRQQKPERVYVEVNSSFDCTGYMQPRSITWKDGRTWTIDGVKDFRPASSIEQRLPGDCYTVMIAGKLRHLFFECSRDLSASHIGRWFVEVLAQR